jgi:radical SAM protein with 4Fe4S-binding SPASM domain
MEAKTMPGLDSEPYCASPYLQSIGTAKFTEKMFHRHGDRYRAYREQWAQAEAGKVLPFPVNVGFDLIDACNLQCPQCLRDPELIDKYRGFLGKGSRLELADVARIMDECQERGLPSVNIIGSGEPMLHPDFAAICGEIARRDVLEFRVVSNGTLLSSKVAQALIEHQVHFLSISIDATTPETYQKVRGRSDLFERVVHNALRFLEMRRTAGKEFPMLRVTFVQQRANFTEVEPFVDFWRDKADLIDIQPHIDYRSQNYRRDFTCSDPWLRLSVYADGHVAPCCSLPGIIFNLGDARKTSLAEIWHGQPLAKLRQALSEKRYSEVCLKCQGSLDILSAT